MTKTATPTPILDLQAGLTGRAILPGDAEYDTARMIFLGGVDKHPAVIIKAANVADVQRGLAVARETGLELAIRSGGHSGAAHSTSEGGIVLDLSELNAVEFDLAHQTAWAEPGLTAGEFTEKAAEHGLAAGFGDTGSVGLGGLILGGGVGYLSRKYGLTIDSLLAVDLVTADGVLHQVDAAREPDLFWALRGGGGNFGVATRFKLKLQPIDQVYGGMLILPATPETINGFVELAAAAPEELSTIANVMGAPPMPFLPAEVHGKLIIMAIMVYAGSPAEGEKVFAPFRALAKPHADLVKPMRYKEIYPPEDNSYHPVSVARNLFIDRFDRQTAETILKFLNASNAMLKAAQIRVLGGAISRVPSDATAYAHRARPIMLNLAAIYGDPAQVAPHLQWVNDFMAALSAGHQPGVYVNFLADDGTARVREAYPGGTWDRLLAIKQQYDPTNLFRLNQNITA